MVKKNNELVNVIDEKLRKLESNFKDEENFELRNFFIKKNIEGRNTLYQLKKNHPIFWEKLVGIKKHREKNLVLETKISTSASKETLMNEINKMEFMFKESVASLNQTSANDLSFEAVSDWMIRCPLDFKIEK